MTRAGLSLALSGAVLAAGLLLAGGATAAAGCPHDDAARVWTAPLRPQTGSPLQILAVATDGELDEVVATGPGGHPATLPTTRAGGPPWSLHGTVDEPGAGTYRFDAMRDGRVVACSEVTIGRGPSDRGSGRWDLAANALYAAWIERLFDAPPDQSLSFPSLAPVLRDPARNFLHGYLGTGADERLPAEPDCADLSYFLRAYFAWKLGLPIAYRACSRGTSTRPPRCEPPMLEQAFTAFPARTSTFRAVSRQVMDTIHSGSGRTALRDEATDLYPVALDRSALWPGTVYADPYGHTLILVKWIPQTAERSGLLLAVDAQPDNSVGRKRFWEGTFLFAHTPNAGPGFKAHRPVAAGAGGPRPAANAVLDGRDGSPPYSDVQAGLSPADFYARMERLINPSGLDPEAAYEATLAALMEQIETRLTSVANGEAYVRAHPGDTIPMPSGPAIFETVGPWEDYSTPSRDMRLLIALKVLDGLPDRIRRYPELYVLHGEEPEAAATRIERLHADRIDERFVTYTRSDGSPWRLSLADIYARRAGLEVGYNPNDCVERRWAAAAATEEHATCRRRAPPDPQKGPVGGHPPTVGVSGRGAAAAATEAPATCRRRAPTEQLARMEEYRPWFRETRRPPR